MHLGELAPCSTCGTTILRSVSKDCNNCSYTIRSTTLMVETIVVSREKRAVMCLGGYARPGNCGRRRCLLGSGLGVLVACGASLVTRIMFNPRLVMLPTLGPCRHTACYRG
jgi:hypothetical protein